MIQIIPAKRKQGFAERLGYGVQDAGSEFADMVMNQQAAQAKSQSQRLKGMDIGGLKRFNKTAVEDLSPREQLNIVNKAKELMLDNPNISADEAYIMAMEGQQEGGMGGEKKRTKFFPGQKKGGLLDLLRGTSEKREGEEFVKQHPVRTAAAPFVGIASPLEAVGRFTEPSAPIRMGLQAAQRVMGREPTKDRRPTLSDQLRQGLNPDEQETVGQLENIGLLIPFEQALAGLAKLGKLASFEKMFGRLAKAKGIAPEAMAEKVARTAAKSGIDLEKVAAADAQEADKLIKMTAKVGKEYPGQPAGRIKKVTEKRPLFKTKEASKMREKELEMWPEYQKEAETYEAERMARRNKVKGLETIAKDEQRMEAASKAIPKARDDYERLASQVRAFEDEMARLPKDQRSRAENLLKYHEKQLAYAEENLNDLLNMARTGEARPTVHDLEKKALEKVKNLTAEIESGKEPNFTKRDYNPERIQAAARLEKSKVKLPSRMKPNDKLFQAHKVYKDAYLRRLSEIRDELVALKNTKSMSAMNELRALQREEKALKDLVEHADADIKLHEHQLNLKNLSARQKAEKTFKKLKSGPTTTQQEKVQKVHNLSKENAIEMNERVLKHLKTPEKGSAEKLAERARSMGDPSATAQKVEEATKAAKTGAKKFIEKYVKSPTAKTFIKEFKGFVKRMLVSPQKALFNTPIGRAIMLNAGLMAFEETTGTKFHFIGSISTVLAQQGTARYIALIFRGVAHGLHKAQREIAKEEYRKAVASTEGTYAEKLQRIKKAKEKLKPKDLKSVKEEKS
jgi:hypothetical protein